MKFSTFFVRAAVQIVCNLHTVLGHICSGVSNRNKPVILLDVCLHVSDDCFDISRGTSGFRVIDNLVGRKETQGIGVFSHDINGSKDMLDVDSIVRLLRILSVDRKLYRFYITVSR